jgi:hypothetical protein
VISLTILSLLCVGVTSWVLLLRRRRRNLGVMALPSNHHLPQDPNAAEKEANVDPFTADHRYGDNPTAHRPLSAPYPMSVPASPPAPAASLFDPLPNPYLAPAAAFTPVPAASPYPKPLPSPPAPPVVSLPEYHAAPPAELPIPIQPPLPEPKSDPTSIPHLREPEAPFRRELSSIHTQDYEDEGDVCLAYRLSRPYSYYEDLLPMETPPADNQPAQSSTAAEALSPFADPPNYRSH